jgi:hypothetical protein
MNYKKYGVILLALITVLFPACKTSLQVEKPKETYLPSNLTPAYSELPVKIEVDIKKLEIAINKKINGLVFEGNNLAANELSLKVWKAQNISFKVQNNIIEYRVPLKVWTSMAWKLQKFGLSVGDTFEGQGTIALNYKTAISIDKDWKLVGTTSSVGYQWLEIPRLNVAGVNIPITSIANIALNKFESVISKQIDNSLAESIDIKKHITQTWTQLQKPQLINEENQLWVRLSPSTISLSPFQTENNKLNVSVAVKTQIESFMGITPPTNKTVPLPSLQLSKEMPEQFNLNIATDITFEKIIEIAKKQLINKTFADGNKKITITDLSLFGSEGKAVFVADVKGSINGRIYFNGNIAYNSEKNAIEILNPAFDIKTKNALVKSAQWLMKGIILNKLSNYLIYPLNDDIAKIKTDANKLLSNYTIYDGISLTGKLNNVSILSLNLIPGAIRLETNVKGNVALQLDDLNF